MLSERICDAYPEPEDSTLKYTFKPNESTPRQMSSLLRSPAAKDEMAVKILVELRQKHSPTGPWARYCGYEICDDIPNGKLKHCLSYFPRYICNRTPMEALPVLMVSVTHFLLPLHSSKTSTKLRTHSLYVHSSLVFGFILEPTEPGFMESGFITYELRLAVHRGKKRIGGSRLYNWRGGCCSRGSHGGEAGGL